MIIRKVVEIMIIKGLEFDKTCDCSPEQYDVKDNKGNIVGYVRLRWGFLSCKCPNIDGEVVYSCEIGDDYTGMFTSEEEREYHLEQIANAIHRRIVSVGAKTGGGMSYGNKVELMHVMGI